ncbi:hypothetical protein ABB37_01375 [Leptomonas pyrrhocoris]|uniref:CNNM transmembrane domain-containing protein n=1 Tax=Leptomonas pyrrhocoris TaxID=157538 RepID=A0A0M9G8M8_LEPPY|nr:hypothetical protein ABB37_01375 [Leptomonas pyrrhocoris]KPA84927.1 hypothetical protein ABB37_01375 [Leptomonas pyrrhocoris]|eukprot:XP_015663366.1 hypothetical protein ABB37_01375 [Leptomonas pyrrhocoris]
MGETFFGMSVTVPAPIGVLIVLVLICLAGMMAGLVLCVFSLDIGRLTGIAYSGNQADAEGAKRLLAILEKPHWLLMALLTWNDIALEMMPLVLNAFLNPVVAIVTSVAITLIFCEILPQAIFIHHAFEFCAFLSPFIRALMWVTAPVAWPIGRLMDAIVGDKEAVFFQRRELREIIRIQDEMNEKKRQEKRAAQESGQEDEENESDEEDLTKEEATLMLNVLSLSESTAKDMIQIPIADMFKWHIDTILSHSAIAEVFAKGYNFIPVYEDLNNPANVTQLLMTKMLLLLIYRSESEELRVRDLQLMPLTRFSGGTQATDIFVHLQRISPSIVAITDGGDDKVIGLLTLRNVSEQLHETTFEAEMDPRNHSPMQLMMRSWKVFRRVGEYTLNVSTRPSSLNASFSLYSAIPAAERSIRGGDATDRLNIVSNRSTPPPPLGRVAREGTGIGGHP